jgi:hypothetical protein
MAEIARFSHDEPCFCGMRIAFIRNKSMDMKASDVMTRIVITLEVQAPND